MFNPSRRLFLAAAALALASASGASVRADDTVKVGVLHSLSGTMAISETSLRDVVLMAVEEINASGGVIGKQIEPVVVDPASNWPLFAEKAKQLIVQDKVAVTFGCWTSVSRKSCLPVFEAKYSKSENPYGGGLLFYPVQYEGEEQSHNVFYTGASPNEQLIPAAEYMMSKDGGSKTKFYLLGTDYVFPRTANKVLKAFLLAKGVPAANIAEEYTPFGHSDYQTILREDQGLREGRGRLRAFDHQRRQQRPVLQGVRQPGADGGQVSGHGVLGGRGRAAVDGDREAGGPPCRVELLPVDRYARRTRSSSRRSRPTARATSFRAGSTRVTDDPIEAAYFGVYVWKMAVEKAGSFDIEKVIPAVLGHGVRCPGREEEDGQAEPPHVEAGADRLDQGRRAVRHHLQDGPGSSRFVQHVPPHA